MTRFELLLCRKDWNLASKLLRFFMWSRWSHSAVLDMQTGIVYESTFLGGGCKEVPFGKWRERYSVVERRAIQVLSLSEGKAETWLKDQTGKPYDWTAVVGFLFRRDWQEDDSWFCCEHSETFITLFERVRLRRDIGRVTLRIQDMLV